MATRMRGRSGLAIGLAVVVFCASSTAVAAAVNNDDDSGAAAAKAAGLSVDFHAAGCPDLDGIVSFSVQEARGRDPQVTAGLLRIFFHDCFPQGCDASLLLDKTQPGSEQSVEPQNKGLQQGALQLVETIRGRVHGRCGQRSVSCADILALATSHAVRQAGGPIIPMELGRNDSRRPAAWAVGVLPAPTASFEALSQSFTKKTLNGGMDVVALSGAHTVGMARCSSFKDRLDKSSRDKDGFEQGLSNFCGNDMEKKLAFDDTSTIFDNKYFVALKSGRGLLTSDQNLYRDPGSRWLVDRYAASQDEFFKGFKESMLRLSRLRGSDPGPVRDNCFRSNFRSNLVLDTTDDDEDPILAAAA